MVQPLNMMTSSKETFSVLLSLCERNPPVTGGFPSQRPVTQSFDVFFDLGLNKRLNKWSWRRWFETPSSSLCGNWYDVWGWIRNFIAHFNGHAITYLCTELRCQWNWPQTVGVIALKNRVLKQICAAQRTSVTSMARPLTLWVACSYWKSPCVNILRFWQLRCCVHHKSMLQLWYCRLSLSLPSARGPTPMPE